MSRKLIKGGLTQNSGQIDVVMRSDSRVISVAADNDDIEIVVLEPRVRSQGFACHPGGSLTS